MPAKCSGILVVAISQFLTITHSNPLLVGGASRRQPIDAPTPNAASSRQRSGPTEKESRTPAQQKINSQLLYEIYRRRGEAKLRNVPEGKTDVKIDRKGRALVDVRADVGPDLEKKIERLGGTIVITSREYRSTVAWVPLLRLERLAEDPAVRAIEPKAEAVAVR